MWLIGMMGSGKTTVGALAARHLGVPFYDTDAMIVDEFGRPIADIWAELGEDGFREMEREAVARVPGTCVAAAGGGAVLDDVNRALIMQSGRVVWLRARPEQLAARLGGAEDRPLLGEGRSRADTLRHLLEERNEAYASLATHTIETDDREVEDVTREVVGLWIG